MVLQLNLEKFQQLIFPPLGPPCTLHFSFSSLLSASYFIFSYSILRSWKIPQRFVIIRDVGSPAQRGRLRDLPKMTQFLTPVRLWHPWGRPLWPLLCRALQGPVPCHRRCCTNQLQWAKLNLPCARWIFILGNRSKTKISWEATLEFKGPVLCEELGLGCIL